MSLRGVIDQVRGREKTLTVYTDPETAIVSDLRAYFASQNVVVVEADADDRPEYAVLSDGEEYLAAVGIDALRALTDGSARTVGEDVSYSPLLEHLDRTTFTSYSHHQMVQASREIEDRAWRANDGRLHAGFQHLSKFRPQRETYTNLSRGGLDVHVYGTPDVDVAAPSGVTVHREDSLEIAATWFVVFDGGGDDHQASALLAEERHDGGYYGVWTYDAALVEEALDALDALEQSV
ncbi:DICT sensory domain-containing protein [Halobacterium wangiae]|uniref:DICT sensory domain-containing protein n=1 Tax=Halobacterium wangiae TaxID=2902623 RepID=UPI001E385F73|nr:DICT sensory domain-containing protein [Halobacterium wangiae]